MNKKRILRELMILNSVFMIYTVPVYAKSEKIDLNVGKTKKLTVSLKKKVKWKSKNTKIVRVSQNGKIKGIKKGKTKIIALCGKQKKYLRLKLRILITRQILRM